jgi:hypothetical protein
LLEHVKRDRDTNIAIGAVAFGNQSNGRTVVLGDVFRTRPSTAFDLGCVGWSEYLDPLRREAVLRIDRYRLIGRRHRVRSIFVRAVEVLRLGAGRRIGDAGIPFGSRQEEAGCVGPPGTHADEGNQDAPDEQPREKLARLAALCGPLRPKVHSGRGRALGCKAFACLRCGAKMIGAPGVDIIKA